MFTLSQVSYGYAKKLAYTFVKLLSYSQCKFGSDTFGIFSLVAFNSSNASQRKGHVYRFPIAQENHKPRQPEMLLFGFYGVCFSCGVFRFANYLVVNSKFKNHYDIE